jgi:hypothetical protein
VESCIFIYAYLLFISYEFIKVLPGRTEEYTKNLIRDSRSLGRDLNTEPPEYETGASITTFSVLEGNRELYCAEQI